MAQAPNDPSYGPTVNDYFAITASVSTSSSAIAANFGPFRGLWINSSAGNNSLTMISISGVSLTMNSMAQNSLIWVQGLFISVLGASTSVFGVI